MASNCASTVVVSSAASTTAAISDSLSGKTRKIVPSAIPAASAIWRVVIAVPWASRSGSVASTMRARRSSGGRAARARPGGLEGAGGGADGVHGGGALYE